MQSRERLPEGSRILTSLKSIDVLRVSMMTREIKSEGPTSILQASLESSNGSAASSAKVSTRGSQQEGPNC